MAAEKGTKVTWTVLPQSMGGGPHGLGDPNDESLRTVETTVMIPQKMKKKAKILCKDNMLSFAKCAQLQGFLMPFKCRVEKEDLRLCLMGWYEKQEFVDECTKEYLQERSEYRNTGIRQKFKKFSDN